MCLEGFLKQNLAMKKKSAYGHPAEALGFIFKN
jgi:hypothetical protein